MPPPPQDPVLADCGTTDQHGFVAADDRSSIDRPHEGIGANPASVRLCRVPSRRLIQHNSKLAPLSAVPAVTERGVLARASTACALRDRRLPEQPCWNWGQWLPGTTVGVRCTHAGASRRAHGICHGPACETLHRPRRGAHLTSVHGIRQLVHHGPASSTGRRFGNIRRCCCRSNYAIAAVCLVCCHNTVLMIQDDGTQEHVCRGSII
jgi:hypothetical protein